MLGMVDRTHRELADEKIWKIANTYHAWRGEEGAGEYRDVPGFCKSAMLGETGQHGHVVTQGSYIGAPLQASGDEPFAKRWTAPGRAARATGRGSEARRGNLEEFNNKEETL